MAPNILAVADFRVYGEEKVDTTVHFELYRSGAFDYGNGTGMSMTWKDGMEMLYDTRYEPVGVDNFKEYAFEFLKGYIRDTLTAEPID